MNDKNVWVVTEIGSATEPWVLAYRGANPKMQDSPEISPEARNWLLENLRRLKNKNAITIVDNCFINRWNMHLLYIYKIKSKPGYKKLKRRWNGHKCNKYKRHSLSITSQKYRNLCEIYASLDCDN